MHFLLHEFDGSHFLVLFGIFITKVKIRAAVKIYNLCILMLTSHSIKNRKHTSLLTNMFYVAFYIAKKQHRIYFIVNIKIYQPALERTTVTLLLTSQ